MLIHERDEGGQLLAGIVQREPQAPPQGQVLVHRRSQGGHRPPLGHGSASVRKAVRSTFV